MIIKSSCIHHAKKCRLNSSLFSKYLILSMPCCLGQDLALTTAIQIGVWHHATPNEKIFRGQNQITTEGHVLREFRKSQFSRRQSLQTAGRAVSGGPRHERYIAWFLFSHQQHKTFYGNIYIIYIYTDKFTKVWLCNHERWWKKHLLGFSTTCWRTAKKEKDHSKMFAYRKQFISKEMYCFHALSLNLQRQTVCHRKKHAYS